MKKFIRNISIIFTTILFGACTLSMDEYVVSEEEKGVHEAYTVSNELGEVTYKYRENVTPLNGKPQEYIVSMNDSVIWFMDNLPSQWVPKAGRYIAANCSEVIHLGLCAKVTNVTRENGMIKVSYVPATEHEVFEHLEVRLDFDYVMPNLNGPEDTLATRACGRRGYWKNDSVFVDFSVADRMLNGGTRAENEGWTSESSSFQFSKTLDFKFDNNTVKLYGEVSMTTTDFVKVHQYKNTTTGYLEEWNDSYSEKEIKILTGIGGTRDEVSKNLTQFPKAINDVTKFKQGLAALKAVGKNFKEDKPGWKAVSPVVYLPSFPLGFMFRYNVDVGLELMCYGSITYKSRTPVRRVGTILEGKGKKKEKIDKEVTIPGINPYSTWEDIYAGGSLDAYIRGRIGLGVLVGQGAGAGMVIGAQLKAGFKASLETDFLDDYTILDRQQFKAGPYITFSGYVEGVANVGPYTFSLGDIEFKPIELIPGAMLNLMAEVNTDKTSATLVAKENKNGKNEYAIEAKVNFKKLETFFLFPQTNKTGSRVALRVYEGGVNSGTGRYVDIYGPDEELKAKKTYEFNELLSDHGLEMQGLGYEVVPCIYNKSNGVTTEYRNSTFILSPGEPFVRQPKCYQWYAMDIDEETWANLTWSNPSLQNLDRMEFTDYGFSVVFETKNITAIKELVLEIDAYHPSGKKLFSREVLIPKNGLYKSGKYSVQCNFYARYRAKPENHNTDPVYITAKPYYIDVNGKKVECPKSEFVNLYYPYERKGGPVTAENNVYIDEL
ncbi:MAG: hypothetical protein UHT92_08390 [Prevotella sp.]|nr:hypothetical protein [Prevotella sp.]